MENLVWTKIAVFFPFSLRLELILDIWRRKKITRREQSKFMHMY